MSEEKHSTMTLQGCKPRPLNLGSSALNIKPQPLLHGALLRLWKDQVRLQATGQSNTSLAWRKQGVGLGASQSLSPKIGCLTVYPMLSPTQHFIIHSLLVTYFTQGGEGKEGERTCRWTCLTIKSLMNLSCSSLSMPERIGDTWVLILTKLVWSRCQKTAPFPFSFF